MHTNFHKDWSDERFFLEPCNQLRYTKKTRISLDRGH
jgi:hypothetical protein